MVMAQKAPTRRPLPEPLLTVQQVADVLQVTPPTIREWLRDGKIYGVKVQQTRRHRWRIPRSEVDRIIAWEADLPPHG